MTTTRYRVLFGALGLVAAGFASAEDLTVRAQMQAPAVNAVGRVADGGAIACQTNAATGCVATFAKDAAVTLTQSAVTNATFVGWGDGCAEKDPLVTPYTGATCTVTMSASRTVFAYFKPAGYQLGAIIYPKATTQTPVPVYGGTLAAVATVPPMACAQGIYGAGVTFLAGCDVAAPSGASVDVVATPNGVSRVTGWVGCAAVSADKSTCTVAMGGPKAVTAYFGASNMPIVARVFGNGGVTATGIACGTSGSDCTGSVAPGGSITLTAVQPSGSKFVGWTGACTGTALTCALTNVNSAQTVVATFKSTSCNACHAAPPASHSGMASTVSCANCHPGYGSDTVDPVTHMDGKGDATWARTEPPAGFGYDIEVVGATVAGGTDGKPTVDVKIKDLATGQYINVMTAVAASPSTFNQVPRLAFGEIQADGSFMPMIQTYSTTTGLWTPATSETSVNANWSEVDAVQKIYRYTFVATLNRTPQDLTRTYRVAAYGSRIFTRSDATTVQAPFYGLYDFVPAGGTASTTPKQTVLNAACDGCHGGLTLHGRRRGVEVCLTCHNINTVLGTATTNPQADAYKWDLKNLVHKLHSGKAYTGIRPDGVTGSAWSTSQASFAADVLHMKMGPSHTTYFEGAGVTIEDPGIMGKECGICHQGADAAKAFSTVTRLACGSCHTSVDFGAGTGHGVQADDSQCTVCHTAAFFPVETSHSLFYETGNNVDFNKAITYNGAAYEAIPAGGHDFQVAITGVTVNATTGAPTITLQATLDGNPFDLRDAATVVSGSGTNRIVTADSRGGRLPTCAITIAGPTTDYTLPATGGTTISCTTPSATVLAEVTPGTYTVTSGTFFAGKTGAYTVGFEIMYQRQADVGTSNTVRKPFAAKPNFWTVSWDGAAWQVTERGSGSALDLAKSRRAAVSFDKCNACHVQLGFHSNRSRQGPDYCAECHNPKLDNGTRIRAKESVAYTTSFSGTTKVYLPESVSMNVFIHKIHMGSRLPSVAGKEMLGTGNNGIVAVAGPYSPEPGSIIYGATRSKFTGIDSDGDGVEDEMPEMVDFSAFAQPSYVNRCDQCHVNEGATKTWALPEMAGLAPIERTYRVCTPTAVPWDTVQWCNAADANSGGMPKTGGTVTAAVKVVTPPLKAVCTSCHDSANTNTHVDAFTLNPMSTTAVERCADCHGAGKALDSLNVHFIIP